MSEDTPRLIREFQTRELLHHWWFEGMMDPREENQDAPVSAKVFSGIRDALDDSDEISHRYRQNIEDAHSETTQKPV
jgi:hypothetical protein